MNTPKPGPRRLLKSKPAAAVAVLLALALGYGAYAFFIQDPAPAWVVQHRIHRHLKHASAKTDFTVPFEFPTRDEMRQVDAETKAPAQGAMTRRDFSSLREQYLEHMTELLVLQRTQAEIEAARDQAREKLAPIEARLAAQSDKPGSPKEAKRTEEAAALRAQIARHTGTLQTNQAAIAALEQGLDPIRSDLEDFQAFWARERRAADQADPARLEAAYGAFQRMLRVELEASSSYRRIYELIGQELWVAARLFESRNPQHRRVALNLARQGRSDALEFAEDPWLAARICEGYLWPHLDLAAGEDRRSRLNPERLLEECAGTFWQADETNKVLQTYARYIHRADSPWRADWARSQLARTYIQVRNYKSALHCLKTITLTNDFSRSVRQIPALEQRVQR